MKSENFKQNELAKQIAKATSEKVNDSNTKAIPDAFVIDPSFILNDFKDLCEKHEVPYIDLLNLMGFNIKTLEFVIMNKTITEQIYVLNRELILIIYKMGLETNLNTTNIRFLLGRITDRIEWLNTMDNCILPYIAGYYKNGKLDPDFLFKDANGNDINEEVKEMLKPLEEESGLQELEDTLTTVQNIDEMTDKVKEDIENMDKETEEIDDIIDVVNGEEIVESVTKEQLEEAERNTTPSDVMIDVDENIDQEKDNIE